MQVAGEIAIAEDVVKTIGAEQDGLAALEVVFLKVNDRAFLGPEHIGEHVLQWKPGQGMMELCAFDKQTGQLLSGSLMDYALPRASDLPSMRIESIVTPCHYNPLGVKGCGEAGAIAGPAALVSAVLDALAPLGVTDIDMPATPERVWRAIQAAKRN